MTVLDSTSADIMERLDRLAGISESDRFLTRRCYTPEHRRAANLIASWMRDAGMSVREDAVGNVIGRYEGQTPDAPTIMMGSHHDSVVMAGKYDGPLGIVSAIEVVATLNSEKILLKNPLEVIAFADEEGVRYQSTLLGSRGVTGTFDYGLLARSDKDGITLAKAMTDYGLDTDLIPTAARAADDILCFLELHIEQGPVLEHEDLAVSAVTAIAGAERMTVIVEGRAGHAGTVPMSRRQDALAAAAACILAVEEMALVHADTVGTVGQIDLVPGATNVIPGVVSFSVDFRAANNQVRRDAIKDLESALHSIADARHVTITVDRTYTSNGIACAPRLIETIESAMTDLGHPARRLPSGAGHDAGAMAHITDVGMIFVRCKDGISHNPAEEITPEDARTGVEVLLRTVKKIGGIDT